MKTRYDLDYDQYRLVWRDITNATNSRTLISTILPPNVFVGRTLNCINAVIFNGKEYVHPLTVEELVCLSTFLNSFVVDFIVRHRVTLHVTHFNMKELPIPRLSKKDKYFTEIVEKSGSLICTTKEFDKLKQELKIKESITESEERQIVMGQLNAIVAKIYGLTKEELEFILDSFSNKNNELKQKTLEEFEKL